MNSGLWAQHEWAVLVATLLFVGQLALIGWLLAERQRRRRSEEARRHLAAIVESSNDAIIGTSLDGEIVSWNTGAELIYGYTADEVRGRNISIIVPSDRRDELIESLKKRRKGEEIKNFETVRLRKNGERIDVSVSVSPIKDERGHVVADATITRDVSESKRAEEALRESEERFRMVADTAPVLIWMVGTDKLCTFVNRAWLEFTGRTMEEELGEGWADGVHPDDYERCLSTYFTEFDARRNFRMEYRLKRHDGEHRWLLETGVSRYLPDGTFAGYTGSCIDITERKQAEEQRKQAEEELQRLAGQLILLQEEERRRIAAELHDSLGQSLVVIKNRATICLRDATDTYRITEQLEEISSTATSAIDEVHEIAHNLRPYELDRLGLVKAVEAMLSKISNSSSIRLSSQLDKIDGLLSPAAETNVFRIIQEGLSNVVKHADATEAHVAVKQDDSRLIVSISDNGKGFRGQNGEVGRGAGFGLAGIAERARMLGGSSALETRPLGGTTLIVTLSLSEMRNGRQN